MSEYLHLSGLSETQITILPDAAKVRDAALAKASCITAVTDAFESEMAADALRDLKTLERSIEDARKIVKAPVLELSRKIDATAKTFIERVSGEALRIGRLLGEYQAEERKKREAAEREARRKEEMRLAQLEQERRERIAQETQGRTGTLVEDLEKAEEEAVKDVIAIRQEASTVVAPNPSGVQTRGKTCWEIEDVGLLLRERPDLFSPDEKKIRAALKITEKIPGLRVWKEHKASVRL